VEAAAEREIALALVTSLASPTQVDRRQCSEPFLMVLKLDVQ
jgi:hypothetical protein